MSLWQQAWPHLPTLSQWQGQAPLPPKLLVTGVHTGIGKTWVTAQLALHALVQGQHVTVLKPCQTGVTSPQASDPAWVQQWVNGQASPNKVANLTCHVGWCFTQPAAPSVAAQCQGQSLHLSHTLAWITQHQAPSTLNRLTLLEGAGGLLVPFGQGWGFAELATALGWPVVLVTTPHLGHLNLTLLTLEALQRRSLTLAALVINLGGDFSPLDWESEAVRRFPHALQGYGLPAHVPLVVSP